ncbi:MAG: phosphoribosylanthranilate isomerase [Xanthomonadales bacterium]|nr:phosphoribosylanthranilate isomerase [Xanthomonadales bacterium]ODU93026.1 MAG: N-(5'-phosphoribosyl)anthranilate isomerase [Rhodanobacter sp. SCN 66-43]OJY83805.1 MAG: N-(5'-phosphoribosyl)anthranilate isomerase [Xanthomonadales bacterium 66-474]
MNRTRVKICGVTRIEDALLACELGADAIGMVMTPTSPRCVSIDQARAIRDALPAFVDAVVLSHGLPADQVGRIIGTVRPDLVQFHGLEDAAFCELFGVRYLKALGMAGNVDVRAIAAEHVHAAGFVLDGHPPGQQGGQGKTFDWSRIPRDLDRPIILAGGLNPGNVGDAIRAVRPWAVDLASGVESSPGVKDAAKLRAFFAAVHAADAEASP